MKVVLSSPSLFKFSGKAGRMLLKLAPFAINNPLNPWHKQREMPQAPNQSFQEWYTQNRKPHEQ